MKSINFLRDVLLPVIHPRTGYRSIRETNEAIFGVEAISRTGPVWGLDEEGELRGCYRPTGHPGVRICFFHSLKG